MTEPEGEEAAPITKEGSVPVSLSSSLGTPSTSNEHANAGTVTVGPQ